MIPLGSIVLVLALLAAWSMGHHYSGAVVGPAFGSKSIGLFSGLALSGVLVVVGATLSRVVATYVSLAPLGVVESVAVLISFVFTSNLTTYLKVPTSTIQLYVFGVLGAALASGAKIDFSILLVLVLSWIAAPLLSYFGGRLVYGNMPSSEKLKYVITGIMLYSALVLGLNDVSNAASSLVSSGYPLLLSKFSCGIAMMVGMVTWGSRLARRVGVDLIDMDYRKAAAAQLTKSIIVSGLNTAGLNASMNQTIISALASMGARPRVFRSIARGWLYSPLLGFAVSFLISLAFLKG